MTWIDIVNPTKEDALAIMDEFHINPIVAEELLAPTMRARVDQYNTYLYLILHFPALHHTKGSHQMPAKNQEVDFIIGKKFLITAHYTDIDTILNFSKTLEVYATLQKNLTGDHAGFLFCHLMKYLYGALQAELQFISDALAHVEDRMFDNIEQELVFELSVLSSSLVGCRSVTRPHHEVLASLADIGEHFFGKDFVHHLEALRGEQYRVESMIHGNFDTLSELRATNNALVSTKQHKTMQTLTLMAFITFPLSLVAALFSMNTGYTPIVGSPNGFWYIILLMISMTIGFFAWFKHKKWL